MSEIQPQPSANLLSYADQLTPKQKVEYVELVIKLIESIYEGKRLLNDSKPDQRQWGRIHNFRAAGYMIALKALIGYKNFENLCEQLGGVSINIEINTSELWEETDQQSPNSIIPIISNRLGSLRNELIRLQEEEYRKSIDGDRKSTAKRIDREIND